MPEVEKYIKWGIVGGVSVFAMYILYSFAKSQGWIVGTVLERRAKAREFYATKLKK